MPCTPGVVASPTDACGGDALAGVRARASVKIGEGVMRGAASVGSHGRSNPQSTDVCMRLRVRAEWSSVPRVSEHRGIRGQ